MRAFSDILISQNHILKGNHAHPNGINKVVRHFKKKILAYNANHILQDHLLVMIRDLMLNNNQSIPLMAQWQVVVDNHHAASDAMRRPVLKLCSQR